MSEKLIQLSGVSVCRGNRQILSDIDLSISSGEFLAITGPNGGGKTTLLRTILKLLKPTSGSVTYLSSGRPVDRLPIGYLPQKNMIDSRFPITVSEVIASGLLANPPVSESEKNRLVEQTISLVELDNRAEAPIGTLSGGQLQRTLLGRALISSPQILVLDEPLSYLDKHFEQHVYRILSQLTPTTTIILVSHEMSVISGMATRHLIVDRTLHTCHSSSHYNPSPCS